MAPSLRLCCALLLISLAPLGCGRKEAAPAATPLQKVKFVTPISEPVQQSEEFPGRTGAVEMINLRSRVTGYLDKIAFEDGAHVKAGDLLFVIDDRTYAAEEARTKAAIDQYQARVNRLERQLTRAQEVFEKKAISQDQFEAIRYDLNEAQAALQATIAAHDLAKLNVEFTRIEAPVAGRISRRLVDTGNLVMANDTPLATLISLDNVYVYFDMDERTVLRLRRLMQQGKIPSPATSKVTVDIALADSDRFDLSGTIDFEDNQVDASTGTLRVRAVVPNPNGLLSPGLFVRVRYPIGEPSTELLIPEESLGSDQGRPFVYVVNPDDKVVYRAVEVGQQVGAKRVIHSGLERDERVVVTGLQRVRRNTQVIPERLAADTNKAKVADSADKKTSAATGPKTRDIQTTQKAVAGVAD